MRSRTTACVRTSGSPAPRTASPAGIVECAGNGRSFFITQQGQTVSGTAWGSARSVWLAGAVCGCPPCCAFELDRGAVLPAGRRTRLTGRSWSAHGPRGNRQPDVATYNTLGYLFDALVRHPVTVEA